MKTSIQHLFNKPTTRIAMAGAGGAAAGAAYSIAMDAPWYVLLITAGISTLAQWLELRWTSHRMRLLLKARRRARMTTQLKGQG